MAPEIMVQAEEGYNQSAGELPCRAFTMSCPFVQRLPPRCNVSHGHCRSFGDHFAIGRKSCAPGNPCVANKGRTDALLDLSCMCRYMVFWHGPPGAGQRQGAAGRLLIHKDHSGHSAWRRAHAIHLRHDTSLLEGEQSTTSRIFSSHSGVLVSRPQPITGSSHSFCQKVLIAVYIWGAQIGCQRCPPRSVWDREWLLQM